MINPFVGGLAIGCVGIAVTILTCNVIMKRMTDRYEERLMVREDMIRLLRKRIAERDKADHRRDLMRQVERPLH